MGEDDKVIFNPLQPMLVVFPIIFYITTFISFVTYEIYDRVFWFHLAYTANVAGVLTSLVAIIPAITAWWTETEDHPYEKKEGLLYMAFNWLAMFIFMGNLWMVADQWDLRHPNVGYAIFVSGIGLISAFFAGFFGWDLVQKYQITEELTSHRTDSRRTTLSPSMKSH